MASPISRAALKYLKTIRKVNYLRFRDEDDKHCIICTNKFNWALYVGDHLPVYTSSSCKHVICQPCLTRHVTANRRNSHLCPLCRLALFTPDIELYVEDWEYLSAGETETENRAGETGAGTRNEITQMNGEGRANTAVHSKRRVSHWGISVGVAGVLGGLIVLGQVRGLFSG